jgi:hypothetical protein
VNWPLAFLLILGALLAAAAAAAYLLGPTLIESYRDGMVRPWRDRAPRGRS